MNMQSDQARQSYVLSNTVSYQSSPKLLHGHTMVPQGNDSLQESMCTEHCCTCCLFCSAPSIKSSRKKVMTPSSSLNNGGEACAAGKRQPCAQGCPVVLIGRAMQQHMVY